MAAVLEEYLRHGGTLVVNIAAAKDMPAKLMGIEPTGKTVVAENWAPTGEEMRPAPRSTLPRSRNPAVKSRSSPVPTPTARRYAGHASRVDRAP